jgi:hypothetical protein
MPEASPTVGPESGTSETMTKDLMAGPPMVISVGVLVWSGPMSLTGANGASSSTAIIQISSKPLISASFSTVLAQLSDEETLNR